MTTSRLDITPIIRADSSRRTQAGFFASRLENPQTWNQYSYALNNPLTNTDPDGYDCVYLNNAGNGVESVDAKSSQAECTGDGTSKNPGTGGYWVDGTATQVTLFTNSNDVGLSGQIGGSQLGQGQSTDAFYSSVNATEQSALETSTDVNNTMLPGVIGPAPNIRYTIDPYQTRLFGTHFCGPGGGGVPINALDAACKAHDECFGAAGLSAANNSGGGSMTLQQAAAAQGCNAALAAAAAAHPEIRGSTRVSEWLKHGDQLLPLLGIDGHLAGGRPSDENRRWMDHTSFACWSHVFGGPTPLFGSVWVRLHSGRASAARSAVRMASTALQTSRIGVSRRTGLLMLAAGLADWVFGIVFLRMHSQHKSVGTAISDSWVTGAYVLLAVIYIVITGRWWINVQRARGEKVVAGHSIS